MKHPPKKFWAFWFTFCVLFTPLIVVNFFPQHPVAQSQYQVTQTSATVQTATVTRTWVVGALNIRFVNATIDAAFSQRIEFLTEEIVSLEAMGIPAQNLTVYISSSGGTYWDTVKSGNYLRLMESQYGTKVRFVVTGMCASGCFLLSTYASSVWLTKNATYGMHHVQSQYPASFWSLVMDTVAQNKHWSKNYTESISPYLYTAQQALDQHLINGIIGG